MRKNDHQITNKKENKKMNQEELSLDFESGNVSRGDTPLMTMFPIPESEDFVSKLRERIGLGFTKEQYEEIKKQMQSFNE
jgi:hypothetical protein